MSGGGNYMSGCNPLSELKNKIYNSIATSDKKLELVKIYCSYYYFVKNAKEKRDFIEGALSLIEKETNILNLLKYILDKNIIIEKKSIVLYNWIFINENVIIRKINIKKCGKGYLIVNKNDSLPIHYLNILNS